MRQAVIIIHGIGEQKPMDTLRSFARNIVGGTTRNKPDKMSSLFELRRLQIPSNHNQPLTDFYEYYWAHHMRDTKIRTLVSWCRSLLFRRPANVSKKLRGYYYILWVILLMLTPIIYRAISSIVSGDYANILALTIPVAIILFIDYNLLRIAYGTIDDAAPCVRIVVVSNFKKKIKFEIRNEKI